MAAPDNRIDSLPPLNRDLAFWGMTSTQFLGAFNDNLFKQLILLWCVDFSAQGSADRYQPIAMIVFSSPFILFSGYAGFLADRYSKRGIVVLCKIAEILVMLLGMVAFWTQSMGVVFGVLFLMGIHSAFFGPSKYGVLPELIRECDIPKANGIFQLTTFLAIIFGAVTAGLLKEHLAAELWKINSVCVLVAILGTMTALTVRRTPPSQPNLRFDFSITGVAPDTWRLFFNDRKLWKALLLSSFFWFLGGVVQQTVNSVGKLQFHQSDQQTSLMQGILALGIGAGCGIAGFLSGGRVNFRLVLIGGIGIMACAFLLACPGWGKVQMTDAVAATAADQPPPEVERETGAPGDSRDNLTTLLGPHGSLPVLGILGLFAGLFAVPLQVFIQIRPPADLKGRVLGGMNLVNFIGIIISGAFYGICDQLFVLIHFPRSANFAAVGLLMLLILLFYPPDKSAE